MVLGATYGCNETSRTAVPAHDIGAAEDPRKASQAIARAEDLRRPADVPSGAQADHDAVVRRAAARAFARILDGDDAPSLRALEDDDDETCAWGAYALGEACKGREDAHVRALAARLASLNLVAPATGAAIDPALSLVRAIGRCGGSQAEPTLRAWLSAGGRIAEAAAYALGELAARDGPLSSESNGALLEAARATPPVRAALYAFGHIEETAPRDLRARLAVVAREALHRSCPERIFAVRALGRTIDARAPADLLSLLASDDATPAERVEAAHALAHGHKPGQGALADAIADMAGDGPMLARAEGGDKFNVLLAALDSADDDAAGRIQDVLWAIARLAPGRGATPAVVRRDSALRCAAAEKLARGAWDSDVLRTCDLGDGETGERAKLRSLDREPLLRTRRDAWIALSRSPHVRIREAALEVAQRHPELGAITRAAVAQALSADAPGLVAVAAQFIHSHPERCFVLAESERRAALDPSAPPPSGTAAHELDAAIGTALRSALAHRWSEDLIETRVSLLDAAVAAGLDEAKTYARSACIDPNVTMRVRAARALAAAGDNGARCAAPDGAREPAPEVGHELERPARLVFDTEAGRLALRFDPVLAPVAVTRLVALARSGFYSGVPIHRVVPGFVAQFGDRGGDGYGGAGTLLRCETSPVPFEPLDIGAALAGRDTGSSQIFVVLARAPHLDGEYAWLGHAEGDWNAVAEGDVILAAHVEE